MLFSTLEDLRSQRPRFTRSCAIAVVALIATAVFSFPAVASANSYGYAYLNSNSNFSGAHIDVKSTALTIPDLLNQFANNDLWVVNGSYFIEAGIIHGSFCCSHYAGTPSFFWGDLRATGGYNSHLGPPVSLNTLYADHIRYAGSGSWSVTLGGGTFTGTSTNTFTIATRLQTGTEVSTTPATACSNQSYMGYWNASGSDISGWSDSSNGQAQLFQNSPPYAYWVDRPNHVTDYINYSC